MENRPPSNANVRTRGSRATKTAAESTSAKRRLTPEQRVAMGKAARAQAPLQAHAEFQPQEVRDPVALLLSQAETRVPDLVPIRHGRMLVSPFTFYRGAALVMAADLRETPTSGLQSQLCGDAHLSNFGAYASPERRLVFDINDFDETLPGPFEWDVKATGRKPHRRRSGQRVQQEAVSQDHPGCCGELPHGNASLCRAIDPRRLVCAPRN
jgi:Uncharacterized protein conserved in bacteria (DUF2252)